ncbi:MAG TPA: hypothetical protein VHM89_13235 [Acidimicrobiales bacterium]|nr:hypothetical protein [Acidimicrobiales bacterium]
MSDENFIEVADEQFRQGNFKEAHINYGRALSRDTGREGYCRRMRGLCSRRVAEQRLQKARDDHERRSAFLIQSARWLAKAEANLESALEEANVEHRRVIREEQALTEELMAEFMRLSGGDPARRLSEAARYRQEAKELLGA